MTKLRLNITMSVPTSVDVTGGNGGIGFEICPQLAKRGAQVVLLPELLRASNAPWLKFMQTWYLAVFGLAIVALMVWLPGGLLSIPERMRRAKAAR